MREWVPEPVKEIVRRRNPTYRELARIRKLPRGSSGATSLLGPPVRFPHAASFLAQHKAIFVERSYDFDSAGPPRIIDGGANIGLASLFWKRKWPDANVTAFEADPEIASLARENFRSAAVDVDLVEAALSDENGFVRFIRDGADAGRIGDAGRIAVPALRLSPYLEHPVDLLKLDIEGAESDVLVESQHYLNNVERLFVEYHSIVGEPQRLGELLTLLHDSGFRVAIRHEAAPPRPFEQFGEASPMDLQLNVWAVRSPS